MEQQEAPSLVSELLPPLPKGEMDRLLCRFSVLMCSYRWSFRQQRIHREILGSDGEGQGAARLTIQASAQAQSVPTDVAASAAEDTNLTLAQVVNSLEAEENMESAAILPNIDPVGSPSRTELTVKVEVRCRRPIHAASRAYPFGRLCCQCEHAYQDEDPHQYLEVNQFLRSRRADRSIYGAR